MINCKDFYNLLRKKGVSFFTGVPDSTLKAFCSYVTDNTEPKKNIIVANEGSAVGLAAGHYLATGKISLVYMQNSGLGNATNPLTSLVDQDVYSIPLLLFIGWRGEPGKKDEPQHVKQGKITLKMLNTLGIPYEVLPDSIENAEKSVEKAVNSMKDNSAPYALVVRKETFEPYALQKDEHTSYELSREDAIKLVINQLGSEDVVVSTTGKASRELFEYREELGQEHNRDFITVGSMGHSSQIALGIALEKPNKEIYCLDGDGSVIMHMGSLAIIGSRSPTNFKQIIINNGAHDSVGGQPTVGFGIDFPSIAKACGYKITLKAETKEEVKEKINLLKSAKGPGLLEIRVNKGSRKNLGRPTTTPKENKEKLMNFLKK